MARDKQPNPDPNENAARIVRESTAADPGSPVDLEAAWLEYSKQLQKVDARGLALIRAAFEAGWAAGPGPGCERPDLH